MNTEAPASRRQFFTTVLASMLCAGTALLANPGGAGRPHAKPHGGDAPAPDATTSDDVLAAMNDLSGILEP